MSIGWSLQMFWVVISSLTFTTAGLMLYLWLVHFCPCFWFLPNTPPGKQTSTQLIDAFVPFVHSVLLTTLSKVDPFILPVSKGCRFSMDFHIQLQNIIHQLTWRCLLVLEYVSWRWIMVKQFLHMQVIRNALHRDDAELQMGPVVMLCPHDNCFLKTRGCPFLGMKYWLCKIAWE